MKRFLIVAQSGLLTLLFLSRRICICGVTNMRMSLVFQFHWFFYNDLLKIPVLIILLFWVWLPFFKIAFFDAAVFFYFSSFENFSWSFLFSINYISTFELLAEMPMRQFGLTSLLNNNNDDATNDWYFHQTWYIIIYCTQKYESTSVNLCAW